MAQPEQKPAPKLWIPKNGKRFVCLLAGYASQAADTVKSRLESQRPMTIKYRWSIRTDYDREIPSDVDLVLILTDQILLTDKVVVVEKTKALDIHRESITRRYAEAIMRLDAIGFPKIYPPQTFNSPRFVVTPPKPVKPDPVPEPIVVSESVDNKSAVPAAHTNSDVSSLPLAPPRNALAEAMELIEKKKFEEEFNRLLEEEEKERKREEEKATKAKTTEIPADPPLPFAESREAEKKSPSYKERGRLGGHARWANYSADDRRKFMDEMREKYLANIAKKKNSQPDTEPSVPVLKLKSPAVKAAETRRANKEEKSAQALDSAISGAEDKVLVRLNEEVTREMQKRQLASAHTPEHVDPNTIPLRDLAVLMGRALAKEDKRAVYVEFTKSPRKVRVEMYDFEK